MSRWPQASSRQPQLDSPQPEHSSSTTSMPDVDPGANALPPASTASLNCSQSESFEGWLPSAFKRTHSL